jgi:molecular chaperone Hsp33
MPSALSAVCTSSPKPVQGLCLFETEHGLSEIHKFLFDGLPVRGVLVRITDAWCEILRRRAANVSLGAYSEPVQNMLGEMTAAAVLMHSSIKFDGALVLQIFGDGPVKLAVVEVQSDFALRATATVSSQVPDLASLSQMVNVGRQGRCSITLDPQSRQPGQQAYQGVVSLLGAKHEKFEQISDVLQHYMLQSEQLDTTLVLAANDKLAAGLLIQRLPGQGQGNLQGVAADTSEDAVGHDEDYRRIAMLASSLKREELLSLDVDSLLRRLFWQESVLRFEPAADVGAPHFSCTCSRVRVGRMIFGLGLAEVQSILQERADIEVGCDFCGAQYHFDAIDALQLFQAAGVVVAASLPLQ